MNNRNLAWVPALLPERWLQKLDCLLDLTSEHPVLCWQDSGRQTQGLKLVGGVSGA
jgi:hypothetical protein